MAIQQLTTYSLYIVLLNYLNTKRKNCFAPSLTFPKHLIRSGALVYGKKLLDTKINGKFFNVIHNLYHNIKSCILLNNEKSSFFSSNCGVRQGENLSPVLFALFLNDLEHYLRQRHNNGVLINFDSEDFYIFFKLIVLLYADDTIIVAEDAESLQKCLDDFATYCNEWKLNINVDKSKVVVFGSRNNKAFNFKLGAHTLEIVDNYKYLGVYFAKSGSFLTARKHIAAQARKALYLLYSRINNLNLPVDLQLKLFDSTVLPILTYGLNYRIFKENVELEPYLTLLQPLHYIPLAKFRTGNHNFPVEILRWSGIPLDERKCTLCEANDIGDEYHYLLQCKYFTASRQRYIHKYYISRPNILKYKELLSIRSVTKLKKLSTFIKLLIDYFKRQ